MHVYRILLVTVVDHVLNAGMFLLIVGGSLICGEYALAAPLGIELVVWDIPIVPVAVVMIIVGVIPTVWALRSKGYI